MTWAPLPLGKTMIWNLSSIEKAIVLVPEEWVGSAGFREPEEWV